jgi:hypothetical protein
MTTHDMMMNDAVQALEEARNSLRAATRILANHPEHTQTQNLMDAVTEVESRLAQSFSDERERQSVG